MMKFRNRIGGRTTSGRRAISLRVLARAVVPAVVATLALSIFATMASAATLTKTPVFECTTSHTVRVYPPTGVNSTNGGLETVYWSPDLYRWNGTAWVLYNGSQPWYWAVANTGGLTRDVSGYVWHAPNNFGQTVVVYNNLPAGYYAVRSYLYNWGWVWSLVYGTTSTNYCAA
jgi:hypothetical protein